MKFKITSYLLVLIISISLGQAISSDPGMKTDELNSTLTDTPLTISGVDNDANGLDDLILIVFEVDIQELWKMEIYINFYDNYTYNDIFSDYQEIEATSYGIQSFSFHIEADKMFNSYFKGLMIVDVYIDMSEPETENVFYLGSKQELIPFNYEYMERPIAYFIKSSLTVTYLDIEQGMNITDIGCNCVDLIIVNVGVYQEITGYVSVWGNLDAQSIDNQTWLNGDSYSYEENIAGINTYEIVFDAHGLNDFIGLLSLYVSLHLGLEWNDHQDRFDAYNFNSYREVDASIFEDGQFEISYLGFEQIDENSNGEVEGYAMTFQFNVIKDLSISWDAAIEFDDADQYIGIYSQWKDSLFVAGIHEVIIEIKTYKLYNANPPNTFRTRTSGIVNYGTYTANFWFEWTDLYMSHPVYEKPPVFVDQIDFIKSYNDGNVTENGYDYLRADLKIESDTDAQVNVHFEINDLEYYNYMWSDSFVQVVPGTKIYDVAIDGKDLFDFAFVGVVRIRTMINVWIDDNTWYEYEVISEFNLNSEDFNPDGIAEGYEGNLDNPDDSEDKNDDGPPGLTLPAPSFYLSLLSMFAIMVIMKKKR